MNRRVTPPKRVTSPTWGCPPDVNLPLQNAAVRMQLMKMRKELTVTVLREEITVLVKGKITVS